ncbi:hypothetical protein [Massilia consociata]|uniref:DUF2971 domain-containing protein n=1 Tax=Massilia consociata TaxID=760117 RepID=A0ABV6FFG8_9BURK
MKPKFELTPWQKKQAALLYLFASDEYLYGLLKRVQELQNFADSLLDQSRTEGRDLFLKSALWGERDTSENWSNHAWSFLADFGLSVVRDIADRASGIYHVTGAYQCYRGMSEYSLLWTTPAEQEIFDTMFASVSKYASYIDDTMNTSDCAGRWNDFGLCVTWEKYKETFKNLPKFRVREDLICKSDDIPPKTGVYFSSDFPDGTLQFAWNGNEYGKLRECAIFNDLGQKALAAVGRSKLWLDEDAMLAFVQKNAKAPELLEDSFYEDAFTPKLAPSFVARNAFTSAPSKWYYVELIDGEFEQIDTEANRVELEEQRVEAYKPCEASGFYFTPASSNSRRYFTRGEIFPAVSSVYGNTIWQWDENQQ